jgi:hypothetical protein
MFNPVIEKSDITIASFKEKPKIKIDTDMNSIPPPIPTSEEIVPIIIPKTNASIINSSPNGNLLREK